MSDALEQAVNIRRDAKTLRADLTRPDLEAMSHQDRTDLWIAAKRAANYLYSIAKDLDPLLLAAAGGVKGWKGSDGTGVDVKSLFEVEVLDEDKFSAWAQDRGVDALQAKWSVTPEARKAVREALYDDGEKVPGVSAGEGNPFLSLGRGGAS